jgi:hypothetical protein
MTSILEVEQLDTLSSNASSTLTIGGTNTTTIAFGPNVTTTPSSLANTPSFQAFKATDQTISANSYVQIQFDTKDYDTNTCYNNTGSSTTLNGLTAPAYSFVPNVVGKYLIGAASTLQPTDGSSRLMWFCGQKIIGA